MVIDPRCFSSTDGSITINITNGEPAYTIRWVSNGNQQTVINNAGSRGGTYTITGLSAGIYNVTVTDAANQTQVITHTLNPPSQIVVNRTVTGDAGTCTGSIVLGVTGGTGSYTYQWNTGATSRDLFNLCCNDGRRYSVIVKDNNNCQVSTNNDTISCNIATLSLISGRISDPLCASDPTNSRIEVTIGGGVLPYTYEWRNQAGTVVGNNSPILLNQPPGRYYLKVLDSRAPNQQSLVYEAVLKIKSTLAIVTTPIDASDNVKADGGTRIDITPGVAPYTIRWQDGTTSTTSALTITNSMLKAGRGELTLTDSFGCFIKKEVTINSKACASIIINSVYTTASGTFNIRCAKVCDGRATIVGFSPDVALPIRSYEWSTSGETGPSAYKLCGGLQSVKVTDANGKVCVTPLELKAPPVLKIDTIWIDDKARTLEAVPKGGVPPYTYRWTTDNIDTSRKVTVNRSGKYVVLLTDALGCDDISKAAEIIFDANCLEGAVILSPNDDGRNENFRIKSCSYKSIRLEVYNRWGQLVYYSDDYREQWYGNKTDGPSGDPLPDGVYMYVLSATDATGKQQLGKGTVNIVRN
jgi:gliding motility-associated-like protein